MGADAVSGAEAALLGPDVPSMAQMSPQWPQLPFDGQEGPLMAAVTSQWPWHPLHSPGGTQSIKWHLE